MEAQRSIKKNAALTAEREAIVRRLPEAQAGQAIVQPRIKLRPQNANDVFAGRRGCAKFLRLDIEVLVLPRPERSFDAMEQRAKTVKRSAPLIVGTADRRLRQIAMTMAARVVALAIKGKVLGLGEAGRVQAVRGAERPLHSKEKISVMPVPAKKSSRSCSRTR